jgi:23S rRNA pseudouridine2605 synthase
MPPPTRFWVVLIGKTPTSFHAKEREDLLPTLRQLQRTQKDVSLRWFERGKVWESPEAAMGAAKLAETEAREKRTKEWRPGGEHRDPKARFELTRDQKRAKFKRDQRGGGGDEGPPSPFGPRAPREDRPPSDRPRWDRPRPEGRTDRPRSPFGDRRPPSDRPFSDRPPRRDRPSGPPMENPFKDRVRSERPDRARPDRPPSDRPPSDRPPYGRPRTGRPPSGRPPAGRGGGFKPPKRRS